MQFESLNKGDGVPDESAQSEIPSLPEGFVNLLMPPKKQESMEPSEHRREITHLLDGWLEHTRTSLVERAQHFGINQEEVGYIVDHIHTELMSQMFVLILPKVIGDIKNQTGELVERVRDPEVKEQLHAQLAHLTSDAVFNLIVKKLKDECAPQEKMLLSFISHTQNGNIVGSHDPLRKKITMFLLNSQSLTEYDRIVAHEFTHYGLNSATPEGTDNQIFDQVFLSQQPEQRKTAELFHSFALAIHESAAHRSERFIGGQSVPEYLAYQQKINPKIFEQVFKTIDDMAEGKTLAEFDRAASQIYQTFINHWRPNLTMNDVNKAVTQFVQEAHRLKIAQAK